MAFSKGKRGKNTKWISAFANIPVGAGFACPNAPKDVTFSIGFITDLYYICNVKFPNTKKRMIWREVN